IRSSRRRSSVAFSGITQVSGYPFSFATIASEIPVFPLVGSSSARPGSSSPEASAASIIASATRSLIDPVGFAPSSLAYSWTPGFGDSRVSSTSGVPPTRSRTLGASLLATGHRREQDHGRAFADRGLELVERADVLAVDVDVRVLELPLEAGEAGGEIVQELADRRAAGRHLALAADGGAQGRWDPDLGHARALRCSGRAPAAPPTALPALAPAQNST